MDSVPGRVRSAELGTFAEEKIWTKGQSIADAVDIVWVPGSLLNAYAYVQNNPVNLIDPLGLTDCGASNYGGNDGGTGVGTAGNDTANESVGSQHDSANDSVSDVLGAILSGVKEALAGLRDALTDPGLQHGFFTELNEAAKIATFGITVGTVHAVSMYGITAVATTAPIETATAVIGGTKAVVDGLGPTTPGTLPGMGVAVGDKIGGWATSGHLGDLSNAMKDAYK